MNRFRRRRLGGLALDEQQICSRRHLADTFTLNYGTQESGSSSFRHKKKAFMLATARSCLYTESRSQDPSAQRSHTSLLLYLSFPSEHCRASTPCHHIETDLTRGLFTDLSYITIKSGTLLTLVYPYLPRSVSTLAFTKPQPRISQTPFDRVNELRIYSA